MRTEILYFSYSESQPKDGGMARNQAFLHEMLKRGAIIHHQESTRFLPRLVSTVKNSGLLLNARDKKILILQTVFLKFIFPFALFRFSWYRYFVKKMLQHVTKYNTLYIEINDLIYEQALDLGLPVSPTAKAYQKFIFSQDHIHFIFASELMGDFVAKHYGLKAECFQTIINGAPKPDPSITYNLENTDAGKIKYIYAGTLNKGREIEKCLEIFAKSKTSELILIGIDGDWIKALDYNNVHYLGKFDEKTALAIASKCDIGIIPYCEDKLYYNICYPTKNSFYIAAGLPILCTPLNETMRVFEAFPEMAFFHSLENWENFLSTVSPNQIRNAKEEVATAKKNFSWDFLLGQMKLN